MTIEIQPVAIIKTPYKEKFGIPRQPGLVTCAIGYVEFGADFADENFIKGIEQFSHLWLLFQFHQNADKPKKALVRPPRLGGNEKMGVFATRSTFRPNNIGMSLVKLESVHVNASQPRSVTLCVSGMDLLDGTPILDIKPYLPYADIENKATAGFAQEKPNKQMTVIYSEQALEQLKEINKTDTDFKKFVSQVLAQDPRPAYRDSETSERIYGVHLSDFNVRWQIQESVCVVIAIDDF